MTRSKFDIAYNKWLQQLDVGEDDAIWNGIQDELDFIETWGNISATLDEVKPQRGRLFPMRYLKVLAAAAAIILLLFLPVRYLVERANYPAFISERSNLTEAKDETTSEEPILLKAAENEAEAAQSIVADIPGPDISYDQSLASFYGNELMHIIEGTDPISIGSRKDELALNRMHGIPLDVHGLLDSNDAISSGSIETEFYAISEAEASSDFSFRVLELGLVYGYKNTWLLNHETRNGLNPGKLGNTLPTFHQDIGVSSSIEVNNQHLFGLEFLWKSEAGQKYQQYINASYVERNITLDYLKLQAFYFYENERFPGQAIVGGYLARLTMAEELVNKIRLNVDDNYSKLDFGLLAGYQINIAFKNRIIVKPGLRVSYNLLNIFEGNDITPSYFKRTNNFSASFNVTLSYGLYK